MLNDKAVLIVEDNLYLSIDLSAAVEEMDGRVVGPVSTVAEAHLVLDAEHVSAAILDCELADSQVTSVARRLVEKNVPPYRHRGSGRADPAAARCSGANEANPTHARDRNPGRPCRAIRK